jgi:predicted nucleic acid-binding protein
VGEWTFDTSSIRNLDAGRLLGALVLQFRGRVHLVSEVNREVPANSVVKTSPFSWYDVMSVELPAEQALYEALRLHWGSAPGKDQGEAAAITLAAAHGYRLVCDDGVGFRAATHASAAVCTMRTTGLVIAMVRAGWLTPNDGWQAVSDMLAAGRTMLGPIPWGSRADFDALCAIPTFDVCP